MAGKMRKEELFSLTLIVGHSLLWCSVQTAVLAIKLKGIVELFLFNIIFAKKKRQKE